MNEQHDPDVDPEQEERVRALLADLGTAPDAATMPPEVAARLEETLAGLVAERSPSNLRPLRRRWASRAAAAAAAVIVLGVGGVAIAQLGGSGGSSSSDSSTAGAAAGGSASSRAESLDGSATAAPSGTPGALTNGLEAQLPRVTAASFDTDVARLLQRSPAPRQPNADQRKAAEDSTAGQKAILGGCPGPSASPGSTTTPVLYDGQRAVLVIHPSRDGQRLVEAWTCGGGRILDSTHVTGLASPSPSPSD